VERAGSVLAQVRGADMIEEYNSKQVLLIAIGIIVLLVVWSISPLKPHVEIIHNNPIFFGT
jgi:hypothetical protein